MAKPLTRFARFLANKMGYDLLRLQKTKIHHESKSGLGRGGGFDAFEAVVPKAVSNFDIYLRSCARIDVLGQDRARFIGEPKDELILRCVNSLIKSIHQAADKGLETTVSLTIVDDHSHEEFVSRMKALLDTAPCATAFVELQDTGVSASLRETYELARSEATDLIYFAADDYLHADTAVIEMVETYARLCAVLDKEIAIFPSDYPELYKHVTPAAVMLGSDRHWRAVADTTGADVISRATLEKYWDTYMAFSKYGSEPGITEANTIGTIYEEAVPAFSPLPSLSVHFQHFDTLSPYFEWQQWWEDSVVDENIGSKSANTEP